MRIGDMWKMQYYLGALEQNYIESVAIDGDDEGEVNIIAEADVMVEVEAQSPKARPVKGKGKERPKQGSKERIQGAIR